MKNFLKALGDIINLASGYIFIPCLWLGFILATNSSKGWNVQNPDGVILIPVGVLLLLICLALLVLHIVKIIRIRKPQNFFFEAFIRNIAFIIGMAIYEVQCLIDLIV